MKKVSIFNASYRMVVAILALTGWCAGCNESVDPIVVEDQDVTSVVVNSFKLQKQSSSAIALDTVFFTIDLANQAIYNADSLPKGTNVDKLKVNIKFAGNVSSAVVVMSSPEGETKEIDYKLRPGDDIDFTGTVRLNVTSLNGANSASYLLKVNVHKQDPDTIMWDKIGMAELPSRLSDPVAQKSVVYDNKVYTMLQESDGGFTLAVNENPADKEWSKTALSLPFTPDVRSLTAADAALYMLATDGILYTSTDGIAWTSTGETWVAINGAYEDTIVGLASSESGIVHDRYPRPAGYTPSAMAPDFPVKQFSGWASQQSKWASGPMIMIAGGITSAGDYSNAVWGFDGYNWAKISTALPALAGPVMTNYSYFRLMTSTAIAPAEAPILLLMGGIDASGVPNKKVFMSYDFGLNWTECPALAQLPDYISPRHGADLLVVSKKLSANISAYWKEMPSKGLPAGKSRGGYVVNGDLVEWPCPYLYIIGGRDAEGALYNQIWKGVLSRLEFTPLF